METSILNYTFFAQALSFALLITLTVKFVWPPLMSAIGARQKRIAEGLAASDLAQRQLASGSEDVEAVLRDARRKANEIIALAEVHAAKMVDSAKAEALAIAEQRKAAAMAEIEASRAEASQALKSEVWPLVVTSAEKLLGRPIDPAMHKDVLDEITQKLR